MHSDRRRTIAQFFFVPALVLVLCSAALASAQVYYWGSSARLTGRLSIEKKFDGEADSDDVAILRLDAPISVIYRSEFPDDAPRQETTEVRLMGDFDVLPFASCTVVVSGTLISGGGLVILADVAMQVQRIECKETGKGAGILTPDPPSANSHIDPYGCEPSAYSSIRVAGSPPSYPGLIPERWAASDLLMRSGVAPRWSDDSFRSLAKRLLNAWTRLSAAFPDLDAEWEREYASEMLEVKFAPAVQAELDAVSVPYNRVRLMPTPLDSGLEKLCAAVCGCTVVPSRNNDGVVPVFFSPTTNLLYMIRRLRELPDVRMARLVRTAPYVDPRRKTRNVLRVRMLPSAFHFTMESTDLASGATSKRFFVVDDDGAREVSPEEKESMLSFEPPPLPNDVWQ